jgi:hypothetical protein
MHFRLPKPLHGWREFAGEVAIIVLGVMIALGAEQLVEAAHWHQKVGIVRKSLMGELANDRARWEVDMMGVPCAVRDVDELDRWAQRSGTGPPPPGAADLAHRGFFWMHSANWDLASNSDTLDHFPVDEQLAFATLYDGAAHRQVDIEKATDMFERVPSLIALADNDQGRRALRATLGQLKGKIGSLVSNNAYMERHFNAVGVKPEYSDFAAEVTDAKKCSGRLMRLAG